MISNPIMSVDEMTATAMKITGKLKSGQSPADVLHEDEYAEDDQSGGELLPELVKIARK
jgi:hypothetical protein